MTPKWIQKAHLKKNKLHDKLGVKHGEKLTDAQLQKAKAIGGKTAKMAQFAINAKSFKH